VKFLIRDDDTCGFTKIEELKKCYENTWPEIPVCLSITPFRIPGPIPFPRNDSFGVPNNYLGSTKPIPLDNNRDLVSFLKEGLKNRWLDIALHGYHHLVKNLRRFKKKFDSNDIRKIGREYLYGNNLKEITQKGKLYLEEIFNYKINTFVPPGNAISKKGLQAIIEQKLNLIGVPSLGRRILKQRPFNAYNFINSYKYHTWKIKFGYQAKYPFVLNFKSHKEIEYSLLYPSSNLNYLKKEIDFIDSVNGVFVLSTHYHAFKKKIASGETIEYAFHTIIDYILTKKSVEYITYRDLW